MNRVPSHGDFSSLRVTELSVDNEESSFSNVGSPSSSSVAPGRGRLQTGDQNQQVTLHFNNEEEKKENDEIQEGNRNQVIEQLVESLSLSGASHHFSPGEARLNQVLENNTAHRELLSQIRLTDQATQRQEVGRFLHEIDQSNRGLMNHFNEDGAVTVEGNLVKNLLKDNQDRLEVILSNEPLSEEKGSSIISEASGEGLNLIREVETILKNIDKAILFLKENRTTVGEALGDPSQEYDEEVEDHHSELGYATASDRSEASYATVLSLTASEVSSISERVLEHDDEEIEDHHSQESLNIGSQVSSEVPSEPTIDLYYQAPLPAPTPPGYQQFLRGVRREMFSYQRLIARRLGDAGDAIENHNLPLASIHWGTAIHITREALNSNAEHREINNQDYANEELTQTLLATHNSLTQISHQIEARIQQVADQEQGEGAALAEEETNNNECLIS